ncbi:MAG: 30S ribosomal protein S13 [Spirochaetes bacterium]|nr:30S ribosomal protein S13 [Spirochaetota bacterium]
MARIAGVDLAPKKSIAFALTAIYGIGRSMAKSICDKAKIEYTLKAGDLNDSQITAIREAIESTTKVEGDLRTEVMMNIKRLRDIKTYRGVRHQKRLPVRGQRTRTNSRNARGGGRKTVAGKKKVPTKG